jgi:hypothetical protein
MNAKNPIIKGVYSGIEVEVLAQLNHCCLVRYEEREFIVETADLVLRQSLAKAA